MQFNYVKSDGQDNLTVVVGGQMLTATDQHPNWDEIFQAVVVENGALYSDQELIDLLNVEAAVAARLENLSERVAVANGRVYFDHTEVHGVLTDHILRAMDDDEEDLSPLVNFYEKVMQNPEEHSRENLYRWLQTADFTIAPDGNIIAYKGVKSDGNGGWTSIHSGPAIVDGERKNGFIPNAVGSVVEMDRSQVTHDPGVGCSFGLHAGTWSYASTFGDGATLKVSINPRDVVSVPTDSSDQKMRVCRYTILEVTEAPVKTAIDRTSYDAGEDGEDYCPECGWKLDYCDCDEDCDCGDPYCCGDPDCVDCHNEE